MLKGGVQRFRNPYQNNGSDQPAPVCQTDIQDKSCAANKDARGQMHPGIVLGLEHEPEAGERITEALQAGADRKRLAAQLHLLRYASLVLGAFVAFAGPPDLLTR